MTSFDLTEQEIKILCIALTDRLDCLVALHNPQHKKQIAEINKLRKKLSQYDPTATERLIDDFIKEQR